MSDHPVDTLPPYPELSLSPQQSAFLSAYLANGYRAVEAGQVAGYTKNYSHKLVSKGGALHEWLRVHKLRQAHQLRDWTPLARKAQDRLDTLIESENENVSLGAVKETLDRSLGKPTQELRGEVEHRVEVTHGGGPLRVALAILRDHPHLSMAQALTIIEQHPDEVSRLLASSSGGDSAPQSAREGVDYEVLGE